jgi:ABC-2 type transport system ATP-binding protein
MLVITPSVASPPVRAKMVRTRKSGVARVEVLDEAGGRLRLLASHGRSILAAVGDALSGAGLQAEELYVEAGRLDDVFRNLTHAVAGRETRS